MTRPITPGDRPSHRSTRVDARRLWSGGAATAVVAGLVALVGVLAARWLFNVPVLAPRREGAYGDAHTTAVVLEAAAAALVATALMHLLLISTHTTHVHDACADTLSAEHLLNRETAIVQDVDKRHIRMHSRRRRSTSVTQYTTDIG